MVNNSNYLIPENLHNTSIRKVIEFISKYKNLKLEITSKDNKWVLADFIIKGWRTNTSIKCRRYVADNNKFDSLIPIKLSTQIEYIAFIQNTLLYIIQ